ncbi:MAG: hypothetical protein HY669_00195 [Chloroflexi bacterium]|nr:hypothetical protein [Chloroflexota bacterium]
MRPGRGQRGFTLVETVLGLGLTGLMLSLTVGAMSQAWTMQLTQRQDVLAREQLRNAARWLVRDVLNAQNTDLDDGAIPVPAVTLGWTDAGGLSHTTNYSLEGTELMRTLNDTPRTVARGIVSAAFSRIGSTVLVTLEASGARGEMRSLALRTRMRAAEEPSQ